MALGMDSTQVHCDVFCVESAANPFSRLLSIEKEVEEKHKKLRRD